TRDFTFVGDLVDGILRAGSAEGVEGEAFNLASGGETRILDLAKTINRLTGNPAGTEFTARRHWDTQVRRWASITKARTLLGYRPMTALEDGLRITLDWFEKNRERIAGDAKEAPPLTARPELVSTGPEERNGVNGRR
ncbi:MAG: hypothetical protein V3T44_00310, partial [bacterium]